MDEEADATEDVSKKRARITTKPADLELGSDPPQQLLGLPSEGTRTAVFDAHLIVPPVLETHPHLGSTKRTTGMGQKTRRGRVADSHIREDQLIVEIHGEIGTRPVNTIQTRFVLRNKSTRENKTMEEQNSGVVANSNSTATQAITGHDVIKTRETNTANTPRGERVRRNPETKTTGHTEKLSGIKNSGWVGGVVSQSEALRCERDKR